MKNKKTSIIFYLGKFLVISFCILLFVYTLYSHWLTGFNPQKGMAGKFTVSIIVGITWIIGFILLFILWIMSVKIPFFIFFFSLVMLPIGIFGDRFFHLQEAGRRYIFQRIGLDTLERDGLVLLQNQPQAQDQAKNRTWSHTNIKVENWPQSIKKLNPMTVYIVEDREERYVGIMRMSRSWQEEVRIYEVIPSKVNGRKLSDRMYLLLN